MTEHIKTRKKIKSISKVSTLVDLLDSCVLTDEDKEIVNLYYVQGKNLGFIADTLGYSESTIRKKHRRILNKLGKII